MRRRPRRRTRRRPAAAGPARAAPTRRDPVVVSAFRRRSSTGRRRSPEVRATAPSGPRAAAGLLARSCRVHRDWVLGSRVTRSRRKDNAMAAPPTRNSRARAPRASRRRPISTSSSLIPAASSSGTDPLAGHTDTRSAGDDPTNPKVGSTCPAVQIGAGSFLVRKWFSAAAASNASPPLVPGGGRPREVDRRVDRTDHERGVRQQLPDQPEHGGRRPLRPKTSPDLGGCGRDRQQTALIRR